MQGRQEVTIHKHIKLCVVKPLAWRILQESPVLTQSVKVWTVKLLGTPKAVVTVAVLKNTKTDLCLNI